MVRSGQRMNGSSVTISLKMKNWHLKEVKRNLSSLHQQTEGNHHHCVSTKTTQFKLLPFKSSALKSFGLNSFGLKSFGLATLDKLNEFGRLNRIENCKLKGSGSGIILKRCLSSEPTSRRVDGREDSSEKILQKNESSSFLSSSSSEGKIVLERLEVEELKKVRILGIETSCDDTGVAVVDGEGNILGQELSTNLSLHEEASNFDENLLSLKKMWNKQNRRNCTKDCSKRT